MDDHKHIHPANMCSYSYLDSEEEDLKKYYELFKLNQALRCRGGILEGKQVDDHSDCETRLGRCMGRD